MFVGSHQASRCSELGFHLRVYIPKFSIGVNGCESVPVSSFQCICAVQAFHSWHKANIKETVSQSLSPSLRWNAHLWMDDVSARIGGGCPWRGWTRKARTTDSRRWSTLWLLYDVDVRDADVSRRLCSFEYASRTPSAEFKKASEGHEVTAVSLCETILLPETLLVVSVFLVFFSIAVRSERVWSLSSFCSRVLIHFARRASPHFWHLLVSTES